MPLFDVESLEKHVYRCTYRRVEADTAEDAAALVRECTLDYDHKTIADDPGEVLEILGVTPSPDEEDSDEVAEGAGGDAADV